MSDEDLQMTQNVDYMQNIISQRKQDINQIADIMSDINAMAKDLAIETRKQGEKLEKLDDNMAQADNNAVAALG